MKLFAEEVSQLAPFSGQGKLNYWKALLWGLGGNIWGYIGPLFAWFSTNVTFGIVWALWVADMLAGTAVSMRYGLRDDRGALVLGKHSNLPRYGFKALSQQKAAQGCLRLLLWMTTIVAVTEVRRYPGPITAGLAGTVELYIIAVVFFSLWKNIAKLGGNKRDVAAAEQLQSKFDLRLGLKLSEMDPESASRLEAVASRTESQDNLLLDAHQARMEEQKRLLDQAERKIMRLEARERMLLVDLQLQLKRTGLRVMIVDDDVSDLKLCKHLFENRGHIVNAMLDSDKVISLAYEWRPDVIVLDLVQPDRSGGMIADALRDDPRTSEVPLVGVTGHDLSNSSMPLFTHLISTGFAGLVRKPRPNVPDDQDRFLAEILTYV